MYDAAQNFVVFVEDRIQIVNIFMPCVCLANYGASEAVYPCVVVEEIHEYFRSKMRQCLELIKSVEV